MWGIHLRISHDEYDDSVQNKRDTRGELFDRNCRSNGNLVCNLVPLILDDIHGLGKYTIANKATVDTMRCG